MLHRVMRPSIVSERTVPPAYSIVQPVPPAIPILPITARAASFAVTPRARRSEEHTSELQSQSNLVCRLLLEKKKKYQLCRAWMRSSNTREHDVESREHALTISVT